jgi:5-(carboxyamino)imidazole ribonucleotide synthase
VLDPDAECAARGVADRVIVGRFDDPEAASELALHAAVVTYEIEKIAPAALAAAGARAPLRPSPAVLAAVQDRAEQKLWLAAHGFPVGTWHPAHGPADVAEAARALGRCRLKSRHGGYDGRGQARLEPADDPLGLAVAAEQAWQAMGGVPCVVERELDLAAEFSVMVARRPSGQVAVYPPARNWHVEGILDLSVMPGDLPDRAIAAATSHSRRMAEAFGLEGVLAVEWFLTANGEVLVNELAPRPHNTFHTTKSACLTSQFEQFVRAICDLPLGSTDLVRPVALANLLGDLWMGDRAPALDEVLAIPGVRLHLYGKTPRRARKIGHLLAVGATAETALEAVREARSALARSTRPIPA